MTFDLKNASSIERKNEYDRIAKELGGKQPHIEKELEYLPETLIDGEQVLTFISGYVNSKPAETKYYENKYWLIALTDKRVIFLYRGGLFSVQTRLTMIDLDKVVAISVVGDTDAKYGSMVIKDVVSVKRIDMVVNKAIFTFANKLRDAIEAKKNALQPKQTPALSGDDVVTKLEKLAAFLEKGIITQEEFAQEKLKLLAA